MRSGDDDLAFITGAVLEWARIRSGLSRAVVAEKVHATSNQVADWEHGESSPPFKTAQALAKLLKIPFGFLFLPVPPKEELPLPDFRTLDKNYKPSPDFLELLNDVLLKRDWYSEYVVELGEPSPKFVGKFTINSKVTDVAAHIRQTIGITQALRQ